MHMTRRKWDRRSCAIRTLAERRIITDVHWVEKLGHGESNERGTRSQSNPEYIGFSKQCNKLTASNLTNLCNGATR